MKNYKVIKIKKIYHLIRHVIFMGTIFTIVPFASIGCKKISNTFNVIEVYGDNSVISGEINNPIVPRQFDYKTDTGVDDVNVFFTSIFLPNGLFLSLNGLLSGTPTSSQSGNIDIKATSIAPQRNSEYIHIPYYFVDSSSTYEYTISVNKDEDLVLNEKQSIEPRYFNISNFYLRDEDYKFVTDNLTMPDGLTLSSNGILQGTPNSYCTGAITVWLESNNESGTKISNTININYISIHNSTYIDNFNNHRIMSALTMCENRDEGTSSENLVQSNSYDNRILGNTKNMDTVAKKLALVQRELINEDESYIMTINSGYRLYTDQVTRFSNSFKNKYGYLPQLDPTQVGYDNTTEWIKIQNIHESIAYPYCSGHTCGGADDIRAVGNLDFYGPDQTYGASGDALANRLILQEAMTAQGFMPYFGEWWHFSYGDIEWAAFNGKQTSIYQQIRNEIVYI